MDDLLTFFCCRRELWFLVLKHTYLVEVGHYMYVLFSMYLRCDVVSLQVLWLLSRDAFFSFLTRVAEITQPRFFTSKLPGGGKGSVIYLKSHDHTCGLFIYLVVFPPLQTSHDPVNYLAKIWDPVTSVNN